MSQAPVGRRQLLRFLGAGALLGSVGTASGSAEGEYIVGTRSRSAARAARSEAAAVRRTLDFGPFGGAVAGRFSQRALRGLSRRPDVSYVEPDGRMYAIAIDSNDSEVPWGVDRVDAEQSHGAGYTGSGASVAVVDTGIDDDHPDLAGNVAGGVSYTVGGRWGGSSTDPKDWDDGNGHGTHCAGTVAAVDDGSGVVGVAPGASLYGVKVLDDNGSGSWSDVAAGIEWAGDNGMDVASMSLGGGYSSTVENACTYAASKGVLLVAAAGNDGSGTADDHYPGAFSTVVSVGATDRYDRIASFSSTGSVVEMSAPGVSVTSTWYGGGYNTISGTSMACPHVAGGGALLRATGLSASDARARLTGTAEDLGAGGRDAAFGYGLLDVPAALDGTTVEEPVEDTTAPEPPASVSVDGTTETEVALSWTASTSSDVAGYRVYRDGTLVAETTDTVYTDGGLTADTTYTYGVSAFDDAGNESGATETTATTDPESSGGGSAPTIDTFDVASGSPRNPHAEVEMSWSVSGSSTEVRLQLWDGSSYVVDELVSATGSQTYQKKHTSGTYVATLTATNANGTVDASETVSA